MKRHDIGRHLTHTCIISRELYTLIKRMSEQRMPGPECDAQQPNLNAIVYSTAHLLLVLVHTTLSDQLK